MCVPVHFSYRNATALKAFVDRKDLFGVLPMGFGKSVGYLRGYVTRFVALIGCWSNSIQGGGARIIRIWELVIM